MVSIFFKNKNKEKKRKRQGLCCLRTNLLIYYLQLMIWHPPVLFLWRAMCSLATVMQKIVPHFARCPIIQSEEYIIL